VLKQVRLLGPRGVLGHVWWISHAIHKSERCVFRMEMRVPTLRCANKNESFFLATFRYCIINKS